MCYRMDEDGGHLFLKCKKVRQVWRALLVEDVRLSLLNTQGPMAMLEQILELPEERKNLVLIMLWD